MTDRKMWKTGLSIGAADEGWFQALATTGIEVLEIADSEVEPINPKNLRKWASEYGIQLWSCHLPFTGTIDPATTNKEIWENTYKEDKRQIELCGEAGVKYMVIHPSNEPFTPENREEHLQASMEHLGILSDLCKKNGVVLAVENLPRTCLGNCADEMLRIMESNSDLRICFDVNHLLKENHAEFVRKVGQYIVTTHISDYDFIDEKHWFPMQGQIDWRMVQSALELADYSGPFLYETMPMGVKWTDYRENHEYLKHL